MSGFSAASRLARSAHRIKDESKAAAYLRSIVLNLARDNNRRGLVSLRHHLPFDSDQASMEDELALRDDQQQVIDALRGKLVAFLEQHGTIDAQEWKELTGASRKFTIPLAEYFDGEKLTLRVGEVRRLRAPQKK